MLKIRPQHTTALEVQQAAGFIRRMKLHLREIFPVEVAQLDDENLRILIEGVCEQAEEWAVTEEQDVERVLELFICFEPMRRERIPDWIARIVRDSRRSAEQTVCALEDQLRFGAHT
jgi:hypothetical protein